MQSSVNSASVSLLKPSELENVVREGAKGNPIDVKDDSDNEFIEGEGVKAVEHYSVDGVDVAVDTSEFDVKEFLNEVVGEIWKRNMLCFTLKGEFCENKKVL